MAAVAPPRTIRIAGVVTILQAVVGLVFVATLVVLGMTADLGGIGSLDRVDTYGEAGYFGILSAGVLAAGIGLTLGKGWARTPALLVQLLLLGISWYAMGPSQRPMMGLVLALTPVVVLWLMFNHRARAWSISAGATSETKEKP